MTARPLSEHSDESANVHQGEPMTNHDKGWIDDGHTIVPVLDYDDVSVRIVCPGEGCKARYGCQRCEAQGFLYPDGNEEPCPECDESGIDDKTPGCWFANEIGHMGRVEEFCANGERIDIEPGHRIVWRDQGHYDDPRPEWKSKGVESAEARQKRRMEARKAELEASRAAS